MSWGVGVKGLNSLSSGCFGKAPINRADLVGISAFRCRRRPRDLALYQERAPGNLEYAKRSKRYVAANEVVLRFLNPDPYVYLSQLRSVAEGAVPTHDSWIAGLPAADAALTPKRDIDLEVLAQGSRCRARAATQSGRSITNLMNSKRPEPIWRRITPHAFGYDGFRWHVRAYCHLDSKFKDFLLPRILEVRGKDKPGVTGNADWHWNNYFDVIIGPHPGLTESQKQVVGKDYGFDHGRGILSVRYAMLFYDLKRLGLLGDATKLSARTQHIVTLNRRATEAALQAAEVQL